MSFARGGTKNKNTTTTPPPRRSNEVRVAKGSGALIERPAVLSEPRVRDNLVGPKDTQPDDVLEVRDGWRDHGE